ncbi:MAG: hydantoinase/oxoprolinase family protein [Rhodospirillales bacterium]|nr:hydantoinase/oxoprolinase family protein [Rhodospirillales bacterium]MDH3918232.1 hydantoinase/oxoprolinase family protein [Rhodospirillales bacterium]MDH3968589.1 hydantoinase/oxoprolinase family protein [Rhodospirillales bacterium]
MATGWQIGIDIGGTFTDVVAFNPGTGAVAMAKVQSRPDDPLAGLLAGLESVGVAWEDVDDLVHGTTMITNAIVENRLSEAALVATEGFADTLAIGRQNRRHLYRLDLPPKSPPQIPEALRFELRERLDSRGEVLTELSEAAIEDAVRKVAASGVQSVAVSLLHAYANPDHEQRLGARLREVVPYVALSHRVNPEAREFERTATTALSAGVMPLAAGYLDRLEARRPAASRLHLFHSAGGMVAPEVLRDLPLGLAFSGPAAGVAAAGRIAAELGIDNAISFDMGGTTTDVCLIVEGRAEIRSDRSLGERPLRQPMVAVDSIGAGGGSIARLDTGALRVGPDSAGAEPGPACYGRGGTAATVSDANVVLGYLDAERPIGGTIRLDRGAAEQALAPLAAEIGVAVPELALGIVRVANASMIRALRRVTVERGIDGRRCALLAFGGAGPMHAVELARAFGIRRVVVPQYSSAFSALGCLTAEMSYAQQQTVRMASTGWDGERLSRIHEALIGQLAAPFEAAGRSSPEVSEVALVRYSGQSYAVEVFDPDLENPERLGAEFRARHEALYGFATEEPWELVALRLSLSAPREHRPEGAGAGDGEAPGPARETLCWFDAGGPVPTSRYERDTLAEGRRLTGPAIVEDAWSTVVLPPGATLEVDRSGHLHIEVGEAA